ncbi:E3 ubiquitin protein ligase RIE1 [Hibiscus syriacus]|uniref:RING-type E3 ubiquitin transferase n=1 Tax=Hibiscus syriacus TaxID=106335 RepID=A0A6A2XIW1_HIBSY|nr:E3 ubiquitin protein ligase RIE1-like [Hibiscus syriacus]KAE8653724.1 E3 ubiquitin protein ligase RIE1 [Hibiscus syriacus]
MSSTYFLETTATAAADTTTSVPHAPLLTSRLSHAVSAAQPPMPPLLSRQVLRRHEYSVLMGETEEHVLEEVQVDLDPVVALDMLWNAVFVAVSVVTLIITLDEKPNTPIRIWVCGYALQSSVHVVLVWLGCRRRNTSTTSAIDEERGDAAAEDVNDREDEEDETESSLFNSYQPSVAKRCESANIMASFLWWMVGLYWVVSGGEIFLQNAPRLFWLAVVFLAFDVFFGIVCVVLACLIGIALCCCLPSIIAIFYAASKQEGAAEADLNILLKYRFRINNDENSSTRAGKMVPVETSGRCLGNEHLLLPEDAECCICLNLYQDGEELHSLPCNHHFHSTCIVKWLKMKATCPLCKHSILKGDEHE